MFLWNGYKLAESKKFIVSNDLLLKINDEMKKGEIQESYSFKEFGGIPGLSCVRNGSEQAGKNWLCDDSDDTIAIERWDMDVEQDE